MSAISNFLSFLRSAIYAIDVRDGIADAIEQCYNDVNNPTLKTEALEAALQTKIDEGKMAALTIGDGTITGAKLANGTIPKAKLDPSITFDADSAFDTTSTNAIQNKVVAGAISTLHEDIFNDAIKEALLNCFNHVGWEDENGKQYRDALELALYPNNVVSISATLTLGNHNVYTTDNINSLKNFLHVEATKSDGSKKEITDYSLNGDISSAGSHVITVNHNQLTTSFTVTSSTNNVGILYEWDFTKGLNDLRQNKAAVLGTGERVDYPDYTGSFVLGEGTTPPIRTANGLSFNNEQQWCRLFDRNFNSSEYLADKTIQVDVASFSYAHASECHTRFITFADPTASSNTDGGKLARFQDGLIFRNGRGWSYYDGYAWNDSIFGDMTERSDISGHTVALVLNNFTYPKVYIDGVYKGTGNKNHNDVMYGLQIGDGGVASAGGTFYNALITGVRIYSGEVVN